FVAGALSALLIMGSVLGGLALWDMLRPDAAQAVEAAGTVGKKHWYFAEGYTGPGFEEWLLLFNPPTEDGGSGMTFTPDIHFYGPNGYIGLYTDYGLYPGARVSINVNQVLKEMYNYEGDVSIVVEDSTYPFLCERALYFNYKGQITGGSHSTGYSTNTYNE
ncbi:MAG: hypothetical protein HPY75_15125, partial [Actinobacteria bacterium]|nr:hypothetical protein [Actinomycetota bacterium]